jgi:hypothetical protein
MSTTGLCGYHVKIMFSHDIVFDGNEKDTDELVLEIKSWDDFGTMLGQPKPEFVFFPLGKDPNSLEMKSYESYRNSYNKWQGVRRAVLAFVDNLPASAQRYVVWAGLNADKDYGYYAVAEKISQEQL